MFMFARSLSESDHAGWTFVSPMTSSHERAHYGLYDGRWPLDGNRRGYPILILTRSMSPRFTNPHPCTILGRSFLFLCTASRGQQWDLTCETICFRTVRNDIGEDHSPRCSRLLFQTRFTSCLKGGAASRYNFAVLVALKSGPKPRSMIRVRNL